MEDSIKPVEPKMPVGMRPEDWPKYRKQAFHQDGSMKTQEEMDEERKAMQKARAKRRQRKRRMK